RMQQKSKDRALTSPMPPAAKIAGGELRIGIRVAPDGMPCIMIEWPDGSGFLLPRGQALRLAFRILALVRNLFRNVAELEEEVAAAHAEVEGPAEQVLQ